MSQNLPNIFIIYVICSSKMHLTSLIIKICSQANLKKNKQKSFRIGIRQLLSQQSIKSGLKFSVMQGKRKPENDAKLPSGNQIKYMSSSFNKQIHLTNICGVLTMPQISCSLCGYKDRRYNNDLKSPASSSVDRHNDDNGMNSIQQLKYVQDVTGALSGVRSIPSPEGEAGDYLRLNSQTGVSMHQMP